MTTAAVWYSDDKMMDEVIRLLIATINCTHPIPHAFQDLEKSPKPRGHETLNGTRPSLQRKEQHCSIATADDQAPQNRGPVSGSLGWAFAALVGK